MAASPELTPNPRVGVKRAVLSKSIQHPLTLYPTAVGVLGVLALGLFGPSAAVVGAIGAGFGLGLGSWATHYFLRGDRLASEHLREAHEVLEQRKRELLSGLAARLKEAKRHPGVADYVSQAVEQLNMIQQRFETFRSLLGDKIRPEEISYGRFFVVGEQVFLAVLDGLHSIAARLHSISTIDPRYIDQRLKALNRLKTLAPADHEEAATLKAREDLRERQLHRINELLTFNESAITEFDRVNTTVAELRGASSHTRTDIESATQELQVLVDRARKLAGTQGI